MKNIAKGFERLIHACHLIAALFVLPLMVVLVGLDVAMRYFVGHPLSWAQELTGLLLATALMLGLSYSWSRQVHVRMEILRDRGGSVFRAIGDLLTGASGILVFGMIGWQAARDVPFMISFGEQSEELGLQLWLFRVMLLGMCGIFCAQLLADFVTAIRKLYLAVRGDRRTA